MPLIRVPEEATEKPVHYTTLLSINLSPLIQKCTLRSGELCRKHIKLNKKNHKRDIHYYHYFLDWQDSPTNKLLYAKEIPEYKKRVQSYYKQIQEMAPLSEQEMNAHLAEESRVSSWTLAAFYTFLP